MAKRSLGRGLGAIIEEVEQAYESSRDEEADYIQELDLELIEPNPFQPRKVFDPSALKELSESIKLHGLLQPVIVYEDEGRYVLIAGERRLRASKLAGLASIKTIVADIDPKKIRELALIENIQREDLNPIELAISYRELIEEYGITHEELSHIVHKSRAQITNTIRLLSLSSYTQEMLQENKITQGHAKALVGLDDDVQKMAVDSVIGQRLNVRDLEKLVKNLKNETGKENKASVVMEDFLDFQAIQPLLDGLNGKDIRAKASGKKLVIELKNQEDVQKLANLLSGSFSP